MFPKHHTQLHQEYHNGEPIEGLFYYWYNGEKVHVATNTLVELLEERLNEPCTNPTDGITHSKQHIAWRQDV